MQPPATIESIAVPRRSSSSNTNFAGGNCSWCVQIGHSAVVEIQLGHDVGQRDVRFPVRIDRADVPPVRYAVARVDAARREVVGVDVRALRDETGDDVVSEVVAGARIVGVAEQRVVQERGVEHVDAHAGERPVGTLRHGRRLRRLLLELQDPAPVVHGHHAQRARVGERHVDAGDGHLRARIDVVLEHPAVVHLVDVVAGQDQHVPRGVAPKEIEVLVDGVRGALVPRRLDPLLRRQQLDEFVEAAVEEAPSALQVPDEALRLVLRADADAADARIDAVRQREVDDLELAAERHRRLRAPVRQFGQAAPPPSGQDQRQRVPGQRTRRGAHAPAAHERVEQVRFRRNVHRGSAGRLGERRVSAARGTGRAPRPARSLRATSSGAPARPGSSRTRGASVRIRSLHACARTAPPVDGSPRSVSRQREPGQHFGFGLEPILQLAARGETPPLCAVVRHLGDHRSLRVRPVRRSLRRLRRRGGNRAGPCLSRKRTHRDRRLPGRGPLRRGSGCRHGLLLRIRNYAPRLPCCSLWLSIYASMTAPA